MLQQRQIAKVRGSSDKSLICQYRTRKLATTFSGLLIEGERYERATAGVLCTDGHLGSPSRRGLHHRGHDRMQKQSDFHHILACCATNTYRRGAIPKRLAQPIGALTVLL